MVAVLGIFALVGLGFLAWLQQRPMRRADDGVRWDQALRYARVVNVNTATAAELERLPQVGPVLARRIVDDREQHGRFHAAEELTRVPGVGPKTYEALEDYVTSDQ